MKGSTYTRSQHDNPQLEALQHVKKILVTTSTFTQKNRLEAYSVMYNPYGRKLTETELKMLIEEFQPDGIVAGVEPITRNVMESAVNLAVVSRCGVGMDSVDLIAAAELGIIVSNTPEAPVTAVAEMTLALILSWMRSIPSGDAGIKKLQWIKKNGTLLSKKTVGIVGCGRIGTKVAELLQPFQCTLIGYDPVVSDHPYCYMKSLKEVLAEADIVTLHLPLNTQTKHLIATEALASMKTSALLVNTSRGNVIDEKALYEALLQKSIAGAALDVYTEEPYTGRLIELGDVIVLSPHQASSTIESRMEMEDAAVQNVISGLNRAAKLKKARSDAVAGNQPATLTTRQGETK
jgi:D-3-phosphoglycerate dehydrogenase / 2-oxoglutarate reductase